MRLTDREIKEDDKKWANRDVVKELKYCGRNVPAWNWVTILDVRFNAWLCREALKLVEDLPEDMKAAALEIDRVKKENEMLREMIKALYDAVIELDSEARL